MFLGHVRGEIDDQIQALTSADASPVPLEPAKALRAEEKLVKEEWGHDFDTGAYGVAAFSVSDMDRSPTELAPSSNGAAGDDEFEVDPPVLAEAAAATVEAEASPPPEGFVIAITKRKLRRLHFVGCCGKVPGEHYADFEAWGDLLPPEEAIDVTCKVCFRGSKDKLLVRSCGPEDAEKE